MAVSSTPTALSSIPVSPSSGSIPSTPIAPTPFPQPGSASRMSPTFPPTTAPACLTPPNREPPTPAIPRLSTLFTSHHQFTLAAKASRARMRPLFLQRLAELRRHHELQPLLRPRSSPLWRHPHQRRFGARHQHPPHQAPLHDRIRVEQHDGPGHPPSQRVGLRASQRLQLLEPHLARHGRRPHPTRTKHG